MSKRPSLRALAPLTGLLLFGFALWVLHRQLSAYDYADLARELRRIPTGKIALSIAITLVYYAVLSGYDDLALRYVRHPLRWPRVALASFVGYAVSQVLGFPLLTGAPLRYRLYSRWGVPALEIAKVVAFYTTTYWLGGLLVGGLLFLVVPLQLPDLIPIPVKSLPALGVVLLALLAAYLGLSLTHRRELRFREWSLAMPSPGIATWQVVLSSLDWVVAPATLFVLLPSDSVPYWHFVVIYLLGQIAGHASHVPGGLGVFESVILLFLTPQVPAPEVMGTLIVYRAVHYLLPGALATLALAGYEGLRLRHRLPAVGPVAEWASALVPNAMAGLTFLAGVVLLLSGATPPAAGRMELLLGAVPLGVVEAAHLLAGVAGASLLLLARGLQLRLLNALRLALALLLAGAALSLLKGLDYVEAAILLAVAGALWPSRGEFDRRSPLSRERFSPAWVAAVLVTLLVTTWLGFFSHGTSEQVVEVVGRFGAHAHDARFVRTTLAALLLTGVVWAWRVLRPAVPLPHAPVPVELRHLAPIVACTPRADAHLAFLGDKTLLFNPGDDGFVMYAVHERSWVALGDPAGPPAQRRELAWEFRELVEENRGWTVFYDVSAATLPIYLDMGLSPLQLGEEARVPLGAAGADGAPWRVAERLERAGFTLDVLPPGGAAALLPELSAVSQAWLEATGRAERGFAAGRFQPEYLAWLPVGVVRDRGRVVAFAPLWLGGESEEVGLDVVRRLPALSTEVLDFLLVQTMRWSGARGYRWLNLGLAPAPGADVRAEPWRRVGTRPFRHVEHFADETGLRRYLEGFAPVWSPRYLVSPGGLVLPRVLGSVGALLGGVPGR